MSRSQQSSALAELRTLHRAKDVPALRQLYRLRGGELAEAAGVRASGFAALLERPERDVLSAAAQVLDLTRARARSEKYNAALAGAQEAAAELQRGARWDDYKVHLERSAVLGPLLSAPAKYICFEVAASEVLVQKSRLVRLRSLSRRLDGLHVYLTEEALCFRWKGGRGGLDLFTAPARHPTADDIFRIQLKKPDHDFALRASRVRLRSDH